MGKLILFAVILFCIYWCIKLYDKTKKEDVKLDSDDLLQDKLTVDELIEKIELAIKKIESDSSISKVKAQVRLQHYNKQLEKLKKLKNKLNK
jgi:hypothetical protein